MGFRDKNTSNLDKGILKVGEDDEQRNVIGFIAIHVGDLLISRGEMFTEYIAQRTKGEFEVDIYMEKTKRPIWGCKSLK